MHWAAVEADAGSLASGGEIAAGSTDEGVVVVVVVAVAAAHRLEGKSAIRVQRM